MAATVSSVLAVLLLGLAMVEARSLSTMDLYDFELLDEPDNTTKHNLSLDCVFGLFPCSITITGNLVLVLFYGALLAFAAKMISDGAELLLDLGLPAAIIGGIVLPLLGAVPDSVMIVFSGMSGDREEANQQIAVGMGTLAGSTIMLLTLPWFGSLILGRVDIVNGQGVDSTTSSCTPKSLWKQGVSFHADVTYGAIIMLITTIPYFIVQGADWHWGPARVPNMTDNSSGQDDYVRYSSLVTSILALILLIAYLAFQLFYSVNSKRKEKVRRAEMLKRRVLKQFYLNSVRQFQKTVPSVQAAQEEPDEGETKPLLAAPTQRKYARAWRMHKANKDTEKPEEKKEEKEEENESESPKWWTAIKSLFLLLVGVVLVTLFSDPMVDVLTQLTDSSNALYQYAKTGAVGQYIGIPVFYVSFVVTPLCSNASEIISSLIFASKKKKTNTSMTYAQLYGAATMNNTLGLAVFAALIYFRKLDWQFSAEVTVILLIEFAVGIIAIAAGFGLKHTYMLWLGFLVGGLYFVSIAVIALLENVAHWK